jgi:gliding motility-associated lipoprotein GldH
VKHHFYYLLIFFALLSCSENDKTVLSVRIPDCGWATTSPLNFNFSISDTLCRKDFLYEAAYSPDFPWENIWLRYHLKGPAGDTLLSSTDNLFLFQPGSGKPFGKGPAERLYLSAWFLKNFRFPGAGKYQLIVEHRLRQDTLKGIQSLSVRLYDVP